MKLDARQLYYVANYLAVRRHRDILSLLPANVALIILSYLGPEDLVQCSEVGCCAVCTTHRSVLGSDWRKIFCATKVSPSWKRLCHHNMIWKRKCIETRMGVRPVATPKIGGWRLAYKEDRVLKKNWREGVCSETSLLGHTARYCDVCRFAGNCDFPHEPVYSVSFFPFQRIF